MERDHCIFCNAIGQTHNHYEFGFRLILSLILSYLVIVLDNFCLYFELVRHLSLLQRGCL